ncbi:PH domain-containing protein [Oceanobacillus halophilus]|uniref:YdbS-like PH domain-containing protein n=1 Tax=Oceanobacillus halophilus TaxID=930130 RepID=A0A494ZV32_9BACI|nr:PH domain-containing protein [Oceanobacillus halophilus]RKQ30249.1 hypothetical protein D8M06_16290 [Oceanobacillus halophilus]
MYQIKEPTQRISPKTIKVWRITDTLSIIGFLCLLGFLLFLHNYYSWSPWIEYVIYGFLALTAVSAIMELLIIPVYKQKTWRYEIDHHCIQLKHGGAIKKTHMVIPMDKVYYVDTYQGPLLQKYQLSTIKIGTVGYVHEIPGIPVEEATEIRNYIAYLAGISKMDLEKEEKNGK